MSHVTREDCCSGLLIDFSKMELPSVRIDLSDSNLWIAIATIVFNPLYWNLLARWEYRSRALSKVFGSRHVACCALAVSIFLLGIFRDYRFNAALNSQPQWYTLQQTWMLWLGYLCMLSGTILVLSSFFALGFYGTFLGDYFGILMDHRVTDFPFNILDNPMYVGSTLNFLGGAFLKASQSGVFLTIIVAIVYQIAISFEGPFTTKIYAEKGKLQNGDGKRD